MTQIMIVGIQLYSSVSLFARQSMLMLFSLLRYDDSCLAAISHVQSIIRIVRPRPNIRSHGVLFHIEHFCCFTNFSSLKLNIMVPKINRIYHAKCSCFLTAMARFDE